MSDLLPLPTHPIYADMNCVNTKLGISTIATGGSKDNVVMWQTEVRTKDRSMGADDDEVELHVLGCRLTY